MGTKDSFIGLAKAVLRQAIADFDARLMKNTIDPRDEAWAKASAERAAKEAREADEAKAHRAARQREAQTPAAALADLADLAERDGLKDMGPLPTDPTRVDDWAAGVSPRGDVVMRLGVSWISEKAETETRILAFRLDPQHAKSLSDLLHNACARAQLARQSLMASPATGTAAQLSDLSPPNELEKEWASDA